MRKTIIGALLVVSVIVMAGMVQARGPMGGGPGSCGQSDCPNAGVTANQWQKFRADSLGLREQMMAKKFELEKETLQSNPDKTRIDKLEGEISALRTNIHDLRAKAGLAGCDQGAAGCRNNGIKRNCGSGGGQGMGRCNQ